MKAHLITIILLVGLILFITLGVWFPQVVGIALSFGLFLSVYLILHFFVLAILGCLDEK